MTAAVRQSAIGHAAATSVSATFASATLAGSVIVVLVADGQLDPFTVTDNKSGGSSSYTAAMSPNPYAESPGSPNANTAINAFYVENCAAGITTITATEATSSFPTLIIYELTGCKTSGALDSGAGTQSGQGATSSSPSVQSNTTNTLAQANNIVLSFAGSGSGASTISWAISSGWTIDRAETDQLNYWAMAAASRYVTATTALTSTWTLSGSGLQTVIIASLAFKEAAAGGTSVNPGAGSITLTGPVPTVARTANQAVTPSQAAVAFTGQVPTVARTANQALTPSQGAISFTGYAPSVSQSAGLNLTPSAGAIAFTGFAPTLAQTANQALTPANGPLALAGYAPNVTVTSASVSLVPDAGSLDLTGWAPQVAQSAFGGIDPWGGVYVRKKRPPKAGVGGPPPGPTLRQTIEAAVTSAERKFIVKPTVEHDEDEEEVLMLLS